MASKRWDATWLAWTGGRTGAAGLRTGRLANAVGEAARERARARRGTGIGLAER